MADWVGQVGSVLQLLVEHIRADVFAADNGAVQATRRCDAALRHSWIGHMSWSSP